MNLQTTNTDYGRENIYLRSSNRQSGAVTSPRQKYTATAQIRKSNGDTVEIKEKNTANNICTDGKDDGKITFRAKVVNVVQGVGKGAVSMVKSALQHPVKTAATIALGFVPVIGPAYLAGLCAYGIYSGGKEILQAVSIATSATSDSQAKAAFEQIGSGALTTGLSAAGLKGSVGALKGQLAGGSSTVQALKKGVSGRELLQEGLKETKSNAQGVYNAAKGKIQKTYGKIKEKVSDLKYSQKTGQTKSYLKEEFNNAKAKAETKVDEHSYGEKAQDVQQARQSYKDKQKAYNDKVTELKEQNISPEEIQSQTSELKSAMDEAGKNYKKVKSESTMSNQRQQEAKANTEAAIKKGRQLAQKQTEMGHKVETYENGTIKSTEFNKNGTIYKYEFNSKGQMTKSTSTAQDGAIVERTYTAGKMTGSKTTSPDGTTVTNVFENNNGNTSRTTTTKEGKTTTSKSAEFKGNDGSTYSKVTKNGTTVETYTYNGETFTCETTKTGEVWKNSSGSPIEKPTASFKARMQAIKYGTKHSFSDAAKVKYDANLYSYQAKGMMGAINANDYTD